MSRKGYYKKSKDLIYMDYESEIDKISMYSNKDLILLNDSLVKNIRGGSGKGFCNCDMGHPSYRMGSKCGAEEKINDPTWGDGPEKNSLYKLLKSLHSEMAKRGIVVARPISMWKDFCSLAIEVYDEKKVGNNRKV